MPVDERPLRADALRNHQSIVAAASELFAASGVNVSFEEIARRAGVGSATMHRRFPSRAALFEAVYAEQVDDLLTHGVMPSDPRDALEEWLRRFVLFIVGKRAFAEAMAHDTELVLAARRRIYATVEPLLSAAQAAKSVRSDVTADDVLRMLNGIGLADYPEEGQRERVVEICFRGLRPLPES
jgi:AcrR family transcriptional regulator